MRLFFLTLAALGLMTIPAFANHGGDHTHASKTIAVKVDGMVCDFCARALEKVFYQQDGVEGVDVNLDSHIVTLDITEDAQLSDELINKLIADSGYNPVSIERNP